MQENEPETFYAESRQAWRAWLQEHHISRQFIWLVRYKKKSGVPTLSWSESVDEALCFGWIDSTAKTLDDDRFMQYFCKRKANSVWSKINKDKIDRLMEEDLIAAAGHASIERAKQNGSWNTLDEAETLNIPSDLEKAFDARPGSMDFFLSLSKSIRKGMLQWIVMAKRPETKQKRIDEIAEHAAQQRKPKQF